MSRARGYQQQDDEGDELAEHENAVRALQDDADRVEEHHLDVEEDEEHRDQVEADPEAQAVGGFDRYARLVRLGLAPVGCGSLARPPGADQVVEHHEGAADSEAEEGEDEYRQVALQHGRESLYNHIVTTCYIVLFRISKRNPDPFWRI
jgi:hypothetical protein